MGGKKREPEASRCRGSGSPSRSTTMVVMKSASQKQVATADLGYEDRFANRRKQKDVDASEASQGGRHDRKACGGGGGRS